MHNLSNWRKSYFTVLWLYMRQIFHTVFRWFCVYALLFCFLSLSFKCMFYGPTRITIKGKKKDCFGSQFFFFFFSPHFYLIPKQILNDGYFHAMHFDQISYQIDNTNSGWLLDIVHLHFIGHATFLYYYYFDAMASKMGKGKKKKNTWISIANLQKEISFFRRRFFFFFYHGPSLFASIQWNALL